MSRLVSTHTHTHVPREIGVVSLISHDIWTFTEFLDDVGWQLEPWATLNDATGFHLGEGRWLRDRRYSDDYIRHMYNGGNDRHFTDVRRMSI